MIDSDIINLNEYNGHSLMITSISKNNGHNDKLFERTVAISIMIKYLKNNGREHNDKVFERTMAISIMKNITNNKKAIVTGRIVIDK